MLKLILIFVVLFVCLLQLTVEQDYDYTDDDGVEARAMKKKKKRPPQSLEESETALAVPPLSPQQIEFAKKWWKNLGQEQKEGAQEGPDASAGAGQQKKKRKKKPQSYKARAVRPGGDWQFLDSVAANLFPLGDPYTGVPDG